MITTNDNDTVRGLRQVDIWLSTASQLMAIGADPATPLAHATSDVRGLIDRLNGPTLARVGITRLRDTDPEPDPA